MSWPLCFHFVLGVGRTPDPDLSSACAPLRLLIEGDVRHWRINAVEDMRLLSLHQLRAPVEDADWHVHLFGHWPVGSSRAPVGIRAVEVVGA